MIQLGGDKKTKFLISSISSNQNYNCLILILICIIIGIMLFNYKKYYLNNKKREHFDIDVKLMPTSGHEPYYKPYKWNNNNSIRKSHNCYSYMLNDINLNLANLYKNGNNKHYLNPQPGHHCGMTKIVNKDETTCDLLKERVLCDNPHIIPIEKGKGSYRCPDGYYKGALTVNPNKQYHFYRQDKDAYWSHKDGGRKATNLDASNKLIIDPQFADRNHSKESKESNFKNFCNYFCIPKNSARDTYASRRVYKNPNRLLYKV